MFPEVRAAKHQYHNFEVSAKDSGTILAEKLYVVLPVFEWTITFCSVSSLWQLEGPKTRGLWHLPSEKVYYTKDYYSYHSTPVNKGLESDII